MKKKKVTNKLSGKRYYGLHFQPGVAEYPEFSGEDGKPLRIYINGDTAKRMDPSFNGKPVYVDHIAGITDKDFQEADGYVWQSFFNKSDGNHWVSFIVTTDRGQKAIDKGWKLSNAYYREYESGPGDWHSVPYDSEVKGAKYEHLAIVENPRYEESVIYTPEEFHAYNERKEKEQQQLTLENSKPKKKEKRKGLMFNMFKKTKVENEESENLKDMVITLPKSGKEVSLEDVIKNADQHFVNESEKEKENKKKNKKKNDDMKDPDEEGMENEGHDDDKKPMNEEEMGKIVRMVMKEMANMKEEEKKENAKNEDDEDKKSENEDDDKKDKMDNSKVDYIKMLQNAGFEYQGDKNKTLKNEVDLTSDQLARGKKRY